MQNNEETSSSAQVVGAVLGYSLCSSTLLLANKAALFYFNRPSVVSVIQIGFATAMVLSMKCCGVEVDDLEWEKIKPYSLYIVAFVAAIYTNMRALAVSNVETVIVFRACTPLAVTIVDFLFMGRALPSLRSTLSLLAVCGFAVLYCLTDSEFALKGFGAYYWVSLYFCLIVFEMTYGKKLTSNVKMKSVWGPVLYTNLLAFLPMFLLGHSISDDFVDLREAVVEVPSKGAGVIFFSCFAGLMIGYTGWLCRSMISATSFTLTGVVNKFITVLLNAVLWSKHSSYLGMACVCGCLVAGSFYEQAPMRDAIKPVAAAPKRRVVKKKSNPVPAADESVEETESLLEMGNSNKVFH